MQFSLFDDACNNQTPAPLPMPDATVIYQPGWLSASLADQLKQQLESELNWHQDTIKLYGKLVKIPRLQAWHGDSDAIYAYSGLRMQPAPWTPALHDLRKQISRQQGVEFNSVLGNWYRHGQDSMGMHADNEPELGREPVIASVTLGQARPFVFHHLPTGTRSRVLLEHGSLLIMRGTTQQFYHHGIAKTAKSIGDRINLTFRYIYPQQNR